MSGKSAKPKTLTSGVNSESNLSNSAILPVFFVARTILRILNTSEQK
jgi:hypothetical protein